MKTRFPVILSLAAAALLIPGCGALKAPRLPKGVKTPLAAITAVRLVDASGLARRFDVDVTLSNPNDFPLPLTHARYSLEVAGVAYASETLPKTTLPALGEITVTLPAVVRSGENIPADGSYTAKGKIEVTPPGQVRKLFYDLGFPKPKAAFAGNGAAPDQPAPTKDAAGDSK